VPRMHIVKKVCSKNDVEITGYAYAKEWKYTLISQQVCETKSTRTKMGGILSDIVLGNCFLYMKPKEKQQNPKEKTEIASS
jgi:hypothetical protein